MALTDEDIAELKEAFGSVSLAQEGGHPYILIPDLQLPDGSIPAKCDALLCPDNKGDGYNSRLYFASKVQSEKANGLNWNTARILERDWHVYSWKLNIVELRPMQMIQMHLKALRP